MTRTTAHKVATELWRRHRLTVPVFAPRVAEAAGLTVAYLPLDRFGAVLVPRRRAVVLNAQHSLAQQNYSCARELCHYVRHRHTQEVFTSPDPAGDSERERTADAFAAELLMPARIVRRLAEGRDVVTLAKLLGVSRQTMAIRAKELRLW